jgi:vesicle-fusing ATPase
MTNRKDMIDSALLRPGRLEVHVEIGLPDEKGREQIFLIHTKKMKENNRLAEDVDIPKLAELSKNFSGAEIEGLVKSASSYALYGMIDVMKGEVAAKIDHDAIIVTMPHFLRALEEVTPAFGAADDELKTMLRGEIVTFSNDFNKLLKNGMTWLQQVQNSKQTPLLSVLLEGPSGAGKTALAAKLALDSGYPYTKVISPENFIGYNENAKCTAIAKVFEDAYKSKLSLIVLDGIERLLEYVRVGPRFSNQVLQTLLVLIKRVPPKDDHRLMIIATTGTLSILKDLEFKQVFNVITHVAQLTAPEHVAKVFEQLAVPVEKSELEKIATQCVLPIGIKQLLMLIEMAKAGGQNITATRFLECVHDCGLDVPKKPEDDQF